MLSAPEEGGRETRGCVRAPEARKGVHNIMTIRNRRGMTLRRSGKEAEMLSVSLEQGEYITIGGDIVVKVSKMARGRCFLAIEADRSLPIVRSAVLERDGTPPPACIISQKKGRPAK